MLPLALVGQLSTSGVGKAVPSAVCKLIWSFVMEHNTAKIIKAAKYAYKLSPPGTQFAYKLMETQFAYKLMETRFAYIHFLWRDPHRVIFYKRIVRTMHEWIEYGERHALPRPFFLPYKPSSPQYSPT